MMAIVCTVEGRRITEKREDRVRLDGDSGRQTSHFPTSDKVQLHRGFRKHGRSPSQRIHDSPRTGGTNFYKLNSTIRTSGHHETVTKP